MARVKALLDQNVRRRIKAEYFYPLDPAQVALFVFGESVTGNYTRFVERVLSEGELRRERAFKSIGTRYDRREAANG